MFCLHVPPFYPRARRGACRGWRPGHGHPSYGAASRFPRPMYGFYPVSGPFFHDEHLEVDLDDFGKEYCFSRAVPGISADNVYVDVDGPVLNVRTLTEVPGQRFKWQILVPDDVETDEISAEIQNGLLKVRFPKKNAKVIPVKTKNEAENEQNASSPTRTSDLWCLENWGSEYRLTHPAPGCSPQDVLVEVEEGFIFVKCHGKAAKFSGEFNLPPAVDVDSIMVEISEGVLLIILPKMERGTIRIHCNSFTDAANEAGPSRPPNFDATEEDAFSQEEDTLYEKARMI